MKATAKVWTTTAEKATWTTGECWVTHAHANADGTVANLLNYALLDTAKTFKYVQTGAATSKDLGFTMNFYPFSLGSQGTLHITPTVGAGVKLYK